MDRIRVGIIMQRRRLQEDTDFEIFVSKITRGRDEEGGRKKEREREGGAGDRVSARRRKCWATVCV